MTIEVSDTLKAWIDQQAEFRGYATADAFVESVLLQTKTRIQQEMDQALIESLESGDPVDVTPAWWEERRRELERRLNVPGKAAS